MRELEAKDYLKRLEKKEEGIPDKKTKEARKEAKKQKRKIRKNKEKAKNEQLKAKKKKSKISQAKHMLGNIQKVGLIDCELVLMCEFDRPYQALDFTSASDRITEFLKKIGDLRDLVEDLINGKNKEITKHSPKEEKLSKKTKKDKRD